MSLSLSVCVCKKKTKNKRNIYNNNNNKRMKEDEEKVYKMTQLFLWLYMIIHDFPHDVLISDVNNLYCLLFLQCLLTLSYIRRHPWGPRGPGAIWKIYQYTKTSIKHTSFLKRSNNELLNLKMWFPTPNCRSRSPSQDHKKMGRTWLSPKVMSLIICSKF